MWTVDFYEDEDGHCPAHDFIKQRVPKGKQHILGRLIEKYIKPDGKHPRTEIWHQVEEFWQLTFAGDFRILGYCPEGELQTIVFLHAFRKKKRKTETVDKNTARRYMEKDIERRLAK